jgi:hypothetical protein
LAGCGLAGFGCVFVGLFGLAAAGGVLYTVLDEPQDVVVDASIPAAVQRGQPFTIEFAIENASEATVSLDTIDIASSYLAGLRILEVQPEYVALERYGGWNLGDYYSYDFEESLAAGESLVVRMTAEAFKYGDFAGEIDICFGGMAGCVSRCARTVVEE